MKASIPTFNLVLISSWIEFWYVKVVLKYLNSSTLSQEISDFILGLCPAFWSQGMTMHLVLSPFTTRPTSLLATTKPALFFSIVCTLPLKIAYFIHMWSWGGVFLWKFHIHLQTTWFHILEDHSININCCEKFKSKAFCFIAHLTDLTYSCSKVESCTLFMQD